MLLSFDRQTERNKNGIQEESKWRLLHKTAGRNKCEIVKS